MTARVPTRRGRTSDTSTAEAALVAFQLLILVSVWQAWVLQKMWRWFVLPTFHAAVPNVATIFGLTMFVTLCWPITSTCEDTPPLDRVIVEVFVTLISWLAAWIAYGVAS